MQTELIDRNILATTKDIDIVNTVTKLGRMISHTRTYFYCADTQKPLAYATHIKYMPSGSWFLDLLWNSKFLYNIYFQTVLAKRGIPPFYEEKPLVKDVIGSHLEFHGIGGRATFHMTLEHTNPFGAMHGGCQAMVMEQVAESYAKETLKVDNNIIILESLQIEFLAAVKGPQVEVICETLGTGDVHNILHVRVVLKCGERVVSDGKLRFSAHHSSSSSSSPPNEKIAETQGLLSSL
jgi:acyl-coenzyme A thioesterase PaaI-like protein